MYFHVLKQSIQWINGMHSLLHKGRIQHLSCSWGVIRHCSSSFLSSLVLMKTFISTLNYSCWLTYIIKPFRNSVFNTVHHHSHPGAKVTVNLATVNLQLAISQIRLQKMDPKLHRISTFKSHDTSLPYLLNPSWPIFTLAWSDCDSDVACAFNVH